MNNIAIPIQIALTILGKGVDVITPPFGYVAIKSSNVGEGAISACVNLESNYRTLAAIKITKKNHLHRSDACHR